MISYNYPLLVLAWKTAFWIGYWYISADLKQHALWLLDNGYLAHEVQEILNVSHSGINCWTYNLDDWCCHRTPSKATPTLWLQHKLIVSSRWFKTEWSLVVIAAIAGTYASMRERTTGRGESGCCFPLVFSETISDDGFDTTPGAHAGILIWSFGAHTIMLLLVYQSQCPVSAKPTKKV